MANLPHIAVCICTYRRPVYLGRLLEALATQETENLFTYSIVIADNDAARSAESIVNTFANSTSLRVTYCVQPTQNIALARNDALAHARGDLIAFIDDDEVPISNWLLLLFQACEKCRADGVVGSVKPNFEVEPPSWVVKGRFCERETYKTGTVLKWPQGRTGNLLFKKEILETLEPPFFRAEFLTAEDQDFFRRAIERGNVFVWCDEAVAYEEVSSVRWNRGFMLKRALLRGKISLQHPTSRLRAVLTSFVAVPLYAMVLPFSALFGKHVFTSYLIRSFDHIGRILGFLKVAALPRTYVTESRR
jgi:succinoglycan biosynthesis protein ExoM